MRHEIQPASSAECEYDHSELCFNGWKVSLSLFSLNRHTNKPAPSRIGEEPVTQVHPQQGRRRRRRTRHFPDRAATAGSALAHPHRQSRQEGMWRPSAAAAPTRLLCPAAATASRALPPLQNVQPPSPWSRPAGLLAGTLKAVGPPGGPAALPLPWPGSVGRSLLLPASREERSILPHGTRPKQLHERLPGAPQPTGSLPDPLRC